jgi:hypothetical protein
MAGGKVLFLGPKIDARPFESGDTIQMFEVHDRLPIAERAGSLDLLYRISHFKEPCGALEQPRAKVRPQTVTDYRNTESCRHSSKLVDHAATQKLRLVNEHTIYLFEHGQIEPAIRPDQNVGILLETGARTDTCLTKSIVELGLYEHDLLALLPVIVSNCEKV